MWRRSVREADQLPAKLLGGYASPTHALTIEITLTRTVAVRLLFAGTIALFVLQLFFTKTEPYPALTMPAFTGHPVEGNLVVVEKPEFRVQFVGEPPEVVPYDTVLPETPLDALPIFKNAFPFYQFAIDDETLAWLESNIATRFPGNTPTGVDVVWRKATYRLDNPSDVTYTTVRTVHLDFGRHR
jgi:hypothetical protein